MSAEDFSPTTFRDTQNTLGSFRPSGLKHPVLHDSEIPEFMAERLLEAGYVIRYDEARAAAILAGPR